MLRGSNGHFLQIMQLAQSLLVELSHRVLPTVRGGICKQTILWIWRDERSLGQAFFATLNALASLPACRIASSPSAPPTANLVTAATAAYAPAQNDGQRDRITPVWVQVDDGTPFAGRPIRSQEIIF
jgi:hypothetical protein